MASGDLLARKRVEELLADVPWYVKVYDIFLQYWPNDNIITDEKGEIVYDIFSMITPSDLAMFKDRPYRYGNFLHISKENTLIGISYKDPYCFKKGDYKKYPTMKDQTALCEERGWYYEQSCIF